MKRAPKTKAEIFIAPTAPPQPLMAGESELSLAEHETIFELVSKARRKATPQRRRKKAARAQAAKRKKTAAKTPRRRQAKKAPRRK